MITSLRTLSGGEMKRSSTGCEWIHSATRGYFLTVDEVERTKTLGSMGTSVGGPRSGQNRDVATIRRATFHLAAGWLSN
jgi:hypothetical protein